MGTPVVYAHRGVAQRYGVPIESPGICIASHMLQPENDYLEKTNPSMQAAFDRGADVVEFDIQPTADGHFAVFHDRTLECKTNGRGLTRAHTLQQLKTLDVGYGYTFDGGRTYPFRGKGIGLLPSIDEIFTTFPNRSFLIDLKSNEPNDAILLAGRLAMLSAEQQSKLTVFGRDTTLAALRKKLPDLRIFSVQSTASCLVRYIAYGWTGVVPAACRNSPQWVPINVAPWLWGWPNRFMNRLEANGGSIIVMGAYPSSELSPGLDTLEDLATLPANYRGGVWTNHVELISKSLKSLAANDANYVNGAESR